MHSLSLLRCHHFRSDHFLRGRDERQKGLIGRARNLYAQISQMFYNVSKTILGKICETKILSKVSNCGVQFLW